MISNAIIRLAQERKDWRKNHPSGFVAKPTKFYDGLLNLMIWECYIPGLEGTLWAGAQYFLRIIFSDEYPRDPPKCVFEPPVFHPNVNESGCVCMALMASDDGFPVLSIKNILLDIQRLLSEPCIMTPVGYEAYMMYCNDRVKYNKIIRAQTKRFASLHRL